MCSNITKQKTSPVYRVIALDLDGTLTNNKKEVTPQTRASLMKAQECGCTIVLASGRPTYGIEPVAECLEIGKHGGYVLSYNGGNIVEWKTKETLYGKSLPEKCLLPIYQYAKQHGYALLGYKGKNIVTENPDDEYVKEESRINKMNIVKTDNLMESIDPRPAKLLLTGHPSLMIKAEQELAEKLSRQMEVYRSAPFFVELVPHGIDKAQSLLRLLERMNLTPADMMAFGDGYNDLSMLRLAGMGVAMSNAAPEVRAEADYVTLSNEADGVAYALSKLCLPDIGL